MLPAEPADALWIAESARVTLGWSAGIATLFCALPRKDAPGLSRLSIRDAD